MILGASIEWSRAGGELLCSVQYSRSAIEGKNSLSIVLPPAFDHDMDLKSPSKVFYTRDKEMLATMEFMGCSTFCNANRIINMDVEWQWGRVDSFRQMEWIA